MDRMPFHESIVRVILVASCYQIPILAALIRATNVPENHDVIIQAWKKRLREIFPPDAQDDLGVVADLVEQQKIAKAKARAKSVVEARLSARDNPYPDDPHERM